MSDPTLMQRREDAAAYWDQVARNHLREAAHILDQLARRYRYQR